MTYDAPHHIIKCDKVPNCKISKDMAKICENIFVNIVNLSSNTIQMKQMIIYFKVIMDKLYIVWIGS